MARLSKQPKPKHVPTSVASLNSTMGLTQLSPSPQKLGTQESMAAARNREGLKNQMNSLVAHRNAIMSNRPRVEKLSLAFYAKAKQAIAAGDEALAKEALKLREEQTSATGDVLLLVDSEARHLSSLNDQLASYGRSIHYLKPSAYSRSFLEVPKAIPKTAALDLAYAPSHSSKIIEQWNSSFSTEAKDFTSFGLYAEYKLNEAITTSNEEQGGDSTKIDPGLPAVCCDLLIKMGSSSFGFRFAPLLRLLTTQIMRCIYESSGEQKDVDVQDLEENRVTTRYLFTKKPWFVRADEIRNERDDLKQIVHLEDQGKSMKDVLDNRNAGIKLMFKRETALARQIAFRSWKNYFLDERGRRRKFKRYQLNMWMRRWKAFHLSSIEKTTPIAGSRIMADGGTAVAETWKMRFRNVEKQNIELQDELADLRRKLELATDELAVTYEIIQDLQPELDHTNLLNQSPAKKHVDNVRDVKAEAEATATRNRLGSLFFVGKKLNDWKDKVKSRLEKKGKKVVALTAFKRQDVETGTIETQTDLTGNILPAVEKVTLKKASLLVPRSTEGTASGSGADEATKKKKKRLGDIAGSDKKVPKMKLKQVVAIISDVLTKACFQQDVDSRTGRESSEFPDFVRDCMIRQYGIKSLAMKNLKSLVYTTKLECGNDTLINVFNILSGVTEGEGGFDSTDPFYVKLIIKLLQGMCPDKNYKLVDAQLTTGEDRSHSRELIVDSFHATYAFFRLKDPDGFREMLAEIMGLPVFLRPGKTKLARVELDSVMKIALKYASNERKCMTSPAGALQTTLAQGRMKNLVSGFAFNTCSLRMKQMMASRKLFRSWDEKLHAPVEVDATEGREGEDEDTDPATAGIFGAFSYDEFSEMVCSGLKIDMDDDDLMKLFNEWHELVTAEKTKLGYEEGDMDELGDTVKPVDPDILKKELDEVEKEIEDESVKLEVKQRQSNAVGRRRASVQMMGSAAPGTDGGVSKAGNLFRPPKPLPQMGTANAKWKMAIKKVKANFFLQGFSKHDEKKARELEAGLGGLKFGESAFCQLLWNHRLFIK
jgi:hypothetical protein